MTMKKTLVLATGSAHKAREMRELLAGCGREVLPAPPEALDVEENAATFAGNARLKALAAAAATGEIALADDSGLCVDALGGKPGVHSKRWAGSDATDADRIAKLLEALSGVPPEERAARFVCAVCIAAPGRVLWEGTGMVEGRIADDPRGEGGFGYDPVFLLPDGRTMAEHTEAEKNAVSHRGRAMRLADAWLSAWDG